VKLPREFCRGAQYASTAARSNWEPVLHEAQQAWAEAEVASLTEGLRDSALVYLDPGELPAAVHDCRGQGLEVTPLEAPEGRLRVAIHRRGLAARWWAAWTAGDDEAIGELLGFPPCCRAFFSAEWGAGRVDLVAAMRTAEGPWPANILLRWLGVRLVPHLPCSADCGPTLERAGRYLEVARKCRESGAAALERLLRLSVTYSARAGVAIVQTPHFRFMATSDPDVTTTLQRAGQGDSEEPWRDNGFASRAAMEAAHAVVARVVGRVPRAIDLGAGDGALLARVADAGVAVELDPGRASRGRARHPGLAFRVEEIRAFVEHAPADGVVLLMPGRLLELAETEAAHVRAWLRPSARLVVYAYSDWLERHGGLEGLTRAAGLTLRGAVDRAAGVEAAEAEVA